MKQNCRTAAAPSAAASAEPKALAEMNGAPGAASAAPGVGVGVGVGSQAAVPPRPIRNPKAGAGAATASKPGTASASAAATKAKQQQQQVQAAAAAEKAASEGRRRSHMEPKLLLCFNETVAALIPPPPFADLITGRNSLLIDNGAINAPPLPASFLQVRLCVVYWKRSEKS